MLEWFNTALATVAIVISVFAWRQNARLRRLDQALEVNERVANLAGSLTAIAKAAPQLLASWRARLAKDAQLNSGLMIEIQNQIEALERHTADLRLRVSSVKRSFRFYELAKVETSLRQLHHLQVEVDNARSALDDMKERLEERRNRQLQR